MLNRFAHIIVIAVVISMLSACGDNYAKIAKKGSIEQKYEYAIKAYDKGQYSRALPLLEELITVYRGTANGEKVLYYYAYSNYNTGDYILAGYHFKSFAKSFPTSPKAEECLYMSAYCFYLTSPTFSLDQTDTHDAIREFQTFINQYPNSTRAAEANEIVAKLHNKLEIKSYEIAKQYFQTYNYKSAIMAMTNVIKDYPDSKYNEELNFLIVKSHYLLTVNSIDSKKSERLKATVEAYLRFIDRYPQSTYLKEAESIYDSSLKLKEKLKIQIT
jgi:outer membrane protein assembly factor BamD